jgi:hypothetical protein
MGFRRDVAVINRSLITVETYRKALFKRYPKISFDKVPEKKFLESGDDPIIRKLIEDGKAPLYFAKTFMRMFDPPSVEDGFNDRVIGTGEEMPVNQSAELFLTKYRLDSASDWSFPWKLYPSVQKMMTNYLLAAMAIAEREGLDPALRDKLLDKAWEIAKFHDPGLRMRGRKMFKEMIDVESR